MALSAIILALSTIASSFLGFARDWLLSQKFGAGADLDAYFTAFRIPDFIFNVLIFGGLSVAFLPLFSDFYEKNKKQAWDFCNNLFNVFVLTVAAVCFAGFVFAPYLIHLIAPGFGQAQADKTVFLSRVLFLSPVIFAASAVMSGVLQYFNRFLAYSFAPLLYNFGIIFGILFLAPRWGITGVVLGVILGALSYFLIQLPAAVGAGFSYKFVFKIFDPALAKAFFLLLPRAFSVAAVQINISAALLIASTLAAGSITIYNFTSNIILLPVSILGVSFATAVFPAFSRLYAESKTRELADKFSQTFCQLCFIAAPVVLLMFVLRDPIVEIVYRHGEFSRSAADLTAACIAILCAGVLFNTPLQIIYRMFFALKDTVMPAIISFCMVALSVFLSFAFVDLIGRTGVFTQGLRAFFNLGPDSDIRILGLAMAFSAAYVFQFIMSIFLLWFKNSRLILGRKIAACLAKIIIAAFAMLLALNLIMSGIVIDNPFLKILVNGGLGLLIYFSVARIIRIEESNSYKSIFARLINRRE